MSDVMLYTIRLMVGEERRRVEERMLTREDSRAEENRGTEVERSGANRGGLHCMIFSFSLSLSFPLSVSFSLSLSLSLD